MKERAAVGSTKAGFFLILFLSSPSFHDIAMPGPERDLRIDFLRGVALLVITLDHIPANRLGRLTPIAWGFSDMAEVFVFLSGFVGALSANHTIETKGWPGTVLKFFRRTTLLYATYVATGTLLVVLVRTIGSGYFVGQISQSLLLAPMAQVPLQVASLHGAVGHLGVLLLYLVLLAGLVPVFWLTQRRPILIIGLSLPLYVGVQFAPDLLRMPHLWSRAMYYNPAAWQVVFLSGSALALMSTNRRRALLEHPALQWAAFALLVGLALLDATEQPSTALWRAKAGLGPLRLAHFAALVVIGYGLLPRNSAFWRKPLLREITTCGQHSLPVYCGGALLSVLVVAFPGSGLPVSRDLTTMLLSWTGCWCIAVLGHWLKSKSRRQA